MNKLRISFNLILIALVICSCNNKIDVPSEFTASQGTYIGVVHLAYSPVDADDYVQYIVYRFNEDGAYWDELTWTANTTWDDDGMLLPDGRLVPGKEYRYKVQAHSDATSFGEFSKEITGYAFNTQPPVITSTVRNVDAQDNVRFTINWQDPNDLSTVRNFSRADYKIYRAENGNLAEMRLVHTEYSDTKDEYYSCSDDDFSLDKNNDYSYKVEAVYYYNVISTFGDWYENTCEIEGGVYNDTATTQNPVIDYTYADLGQILTAQSGNTVFDVKDKIINGELYVGAISGSSLIGGTPSLYKTNGGSWQKVWSCDSLDESLVSYYAVNSSGTSYVLGSSDSAGVFSWDGSAWTRLTLPSDAEGYYGLEVVSDELYMLIEKSDALQVHKYNGSTWSQVGGDIASGATFDIDLVNLDGSLYINYTLNDDLFIKHLGGSNWITDLQWHQENLYDIELAKSGSQLYFSSGSASSGFDGGVYKITSTSTVENMIPEEHEIWFTLGGFDLTIDSDGNLIVASMKIEFTDDSQTTYIIYPHLNLFDGTGWSSVSGDFSGGALPVTVSAIGNDIYYVYGDKSTLNASNDATVLKSSKFTK